MSLIRKRHFIVVLEVRIWTSELWLSYIRSSINILEHLSHGLHYVPACLSLRVDEHPVSFEDRASFLILFESRVRMHCHLEGPGLVWIL